MLQLRCRGFRFEFADFSQLGGPEKGAEIRMEIHRSAFIYRDGLIGCVFVHTEATTTSKRWRLRAANRYRTT